MDLRFLSRNAEAATRLRAIQRRRGVTFAGAKIWDQAENDILRSTAGWTIPKVQKLLPHRTTNAIGSQREKLRISRRAVKPWTTTEDRILKRNIDLGYVAIAKLLPGRSAHTVQGRAWYLGFRKGRNLPILKAKGLPLYDEVRSRAREDGLSMRALDIELRTGRYFRGNYQKRLNWKKLAQAVEFFGARLVIDWQDE